MSRTEISGVVIFVLAVCAASILIGLTLGTLAQLIAIPFFCVAGAVVGWRLAA